MFNLYDRPNTDQKKVTKTNKQIETTTTKNGERRQLYVHQKPRHINSRSNNED